MIRSFQALSHFFSEVEDRYDHVKHVLSERLGMSDPVQICAYRSFGSQKVVHVQGRVLEHNNIRRAEQSDSVWENILAMYRRFESDEVPDARLRVFFQDATYEAVTDKEGYFSLDITPHDTLSDEYWQEARIELIDGPLPLAENAETYARILVPQDAEYGVISDIDDTVLESSATNWVKMLQTMLLKNAHMRLPFEGVAAFYKALEAGGNGMRRNPLFYVSSSPWNMYDFILDFFDIHGIPAGPVLLQDFGVEPGRFITAGHREHKFAQIQKILATYPDLKFILVGDSGQEDPVIYQEVAREFPDRILVVYIRDINLPERAKVVIRIAEEMQSGATPMLLVENSLAAAEHAASRGYIQADRLDEIRRARAADSDMDSQEPKEPPDMVRRKVQDDLREADSREEAEDK